MTKRFLRELFRIPKNSSISHRTVWAANRFWMETENMKSKRYGGKSHHHWYMLLFMMKTFTRFLHLTGQFERGYRNAKNIVLREIDITFPDLPEQFHSFTILHISDLHLDGMPGIENTILEALDNREVDICVLTGDYRTKLHGPINNVIESLKLIIGGIKSRHGILGILGNHDGYQMVEPMEAIGIRMLINEKFQIERNGNFLQFIGTDDVHYYYTDQALHALETASSGFSIALIHSPELYDIAAEMGINLYLCGHTHGGQVCLPGGVAIITHLNRGRKFYKGHWRYKGLQGITNIGAGTSVPIRFNTQGELLILRLKRSEISNKL